MTDNTPKQHFIATIWVYVLTGGRELVFMDHYITETTDINFYSDIENVSVNTVSYKELDASLVEQILALDIASIAELDSTGGLEVNGYGREEEEES